MDKFQKGLDWYIWRVSRLLALTLILGAIAGVLVRCQTSSSVSKAANTMAKTGTATPKNLALLDGEKPTDEVIEAYEDVLADLKQKCREPQHELIYMTTSLAKRYQSAKLEVNNYDAMRRLYLMAKSSERNPPINCTAIYSAEINKPSRKLR
jgi:hypothetical protein